MDYPVTAPAPDHEADAVVVLASNYQFGAGEVVANRLVESRALVCGRAGTGTISTCGRTIDLTASTWAFLPWRHDITYRADKHDPFLVMGVHLIPWHDPTVPLQLHAAHGHEDRLAGASYRRDIDWPDLRGLIYRNSQPGDRLRSVAALTVDHFQNGRPTRISLHAFADLVLHELRRALIDPDATMTIVPPRLARMQQYATNHIQQPMTIRQIATAGAMSESSAQRLFRRQTGQSVGQWLMMKRISLARELLRGGNASVAQVARATGIDDPSYFSRVFKRTQGVSPALYAAKTRLI
jgi:AraC-like DNA-binding protein